MVTFTRSKFKQYGLDQYVEYAEYLAGGYGLLRNLSAKGIKKLFSDARKKGNKGKDFIEEVANNPYVKQTKTQRAKSKKSYEKLKKEHEDKLDNYKKNPEKYDDDGRLKNAKTPEEREKIIQGRVSVLESQIKKHEGEIKKIEQANEYD